jgi:hypothetical protein
LAGDDNTTRTFAMKDVRSIDYGEAQPEPLPQPTAQTPPPSANPFAEAPTPPRYHPPESTIQTKSYELLPGTEVAVRADETIDSAKAVAGQIYAAELYRDVLDSSGAVVLPRGSNAQIVIRSASRGGQITGASDLVLDLQSVSVDGRLYQISTVDLGRRGAVGLGKNERTAKYVGGGAVIGAVIGAIAGHGKGAAIGAGAGAAAGGTAQVITRGHAVRVPAETVLRFRLDKPLRVFPAQ